MKKEQKTEAQIAFEKAEAQDLQAKILAATNTIPPKVRDQASYQAVVTFKNLAVAARKAAEGKQMNLAKLRSAWSSIAGYYA